MLHGHAPGHLRGALLEAIESPDDWPEALGPESIVFTSEADRQWWAEMEPRKRMRWLTGRLLRCGDILPGSACDMLDLPRGSTFAQGVRVIRAELRRPSPQLGV